MSIWDTYPADYRQTEVTRILAAVRGGESVSVVGLSGAGKSNLMGFLANRPTIFPQPLAFLDCNRLRTATGAELLRLIRATLGDKQHSENQWEALETVIAERIAANGGQLTLLLDRFERLDADLATATNLRALRDAHKYQLTYVLATRRPLDPQTELAELFFAHTLWLGPLSASDSAWNVTRYARRIGQDWEPGITKQILALSGGYPSLLRAVCEAYAGGAPLDLDGLRQHPAVQRRVAEFWDDQPSESDLQNTRLVELPLLSAAAAPQAFDTTQLTEKEFALLAYLQAHPGQVCSKDDLVRAVWPEDVIFARGVRDDSLAQLVRRLRVKIEPDPAEPQRIQTVPGRGYLYHPQ